MHAYKMMVIQNLRMRDFATRNGVWEAILQNIPPSILLASDEIHF